MYFSKFKEIFHSSITFDSMHGFFRKYIHSLWNCTGYKMNAGRGVLGWDTRVSLKQMLSLLCVHLDVD